MIADFSWETHWLCTSDLWCDEACVKLRCICYTEWPL